MRTRLVIVLIIVLVAAGFFAWKAIRRDARLEVIRPRVGAIRSYVEEQAVTELPRDHLIATPIGGWLEPIELREGDAVKKGQVLARLDEEDLADRVRQAEQRIAVLETKIRETQDNRLEDNALVEVKATVKAFDETVRAAEAKVRAALAVLEFAESELKRLRQLRETNAASDREIREAEATWRKASADHESDALELAALKTLAAISYIGPKFINDYKDRKSFKLETYRKQLEEARAELEIQKRNLGRTVVTSPVDGVVLNRHQTRRQYLPAGTPLLTLGQLDEMEVTAEVLTEDATRISPDDPVEVFGKAVPRGPITGRVLRVYPAGFTKISSLGVEQQRVKVAVKLDERPEQLGVGFRVHVRMYYAEAVDAVVLPRTSLFRGDRGEWRVMAVKEGVTELRETKIGLMNDEQAQIVEGVTPRDLVVARPSREVVPGMRVDVVPREW